MKEILNSEANYDITIPAKVRFDRRLNANEKLLYGELCAIGGIGKDFAITNQYLASLYHVTIRSVSLWLTKLSECGYLIITIVPGTKKRLLKLTEYTEDNGYLEGELTPKEIAEPVADYLECAPTNEEEDADLIAERNRFVEREVAKIFDDMEKYGAEPPESIRDEILAELTRGATQKFNRLHGIKTTSENSLAENFPQKSSWQKNSSREENFQPEANFQSGSNFPDTNVEENFLVNKKQQNISSLENNFYSGNNLNLINKLLSIIDNIIKLISYKQSNYLKTDSSI